MSARHRLALSQRASTYGHSAMVPSTALYNNGGFPSKYAATGEVYGPDGRPQKVWSTPQPTKEETKERGILVLPDVLTNAGGVTVSYFEWVQDLGRLFWTRDEIRARLADKLGDAFDRVWDLAEERSLSLRDAALVSGIRDVSAALEARGLYP